MEGFSAVTQSIRPTIWGVVIFSTAIAMAADSAPNSQADPAADAAARQLHEQLEQLSVIRKQRAGEAAAHQRQLTQTHRQIDRLKSDLEASEKKLEDLGRNVADLESTRDKQQKLIAESTSALAAVSRTLLPLAQTLRARIDQGIGFRRSERLATIDNAIEGLKNDRPEPQSAGIRGLWTSLAEQAQLSLATQLWNEPVVMGDKRIHAYVARLGLVAQWMVSEDAQTIGVSGPGSAGQWKTDLDPATRLSVKKAMEILQQHTPPQIIAVPLLPASSAREAR